MSLLDTVASARAHGRRVTGAAGGEEEALA